MCASATVCLWALRMDLLVFIVFQVQRSADVSGQKGIVWSVGEEALRQMVAAPNP